jgi:hypothetical protein
MKKRKTFSCTYVELQSCSLARNIRKVELQVLNLQLSIQLFNTFYSPATKMLRTKDTSKEFIVSEPDPGIQLKIETLKI